MSSNPLGYQLYEVVFYDIKAWISVGESIDISILSVAVNVPGRVSNPLFIVSEIKFCLRIVP